MSIRTRPHRVHRPVLERLEERCLPAALFLAPDDLPYALVGRTYSASIEAFGPDADSHGTFTYTDHPATLNGLTFSTQANTLVLSGTPEAAGQFSFLVKARDQHGNSGEMTFDLFVSPPSVPGINVVLDDANSPLPTATAGGPFSLVLNTAGGNGQYTYSMPGQVNGLTLFPYGDTITLSGTPAQAGSFPFTVDVRDSSGASGHVPFMLNVEMGLVPGDMPTPGNVLAPGLVGKPYRQPITAMGGSGALTYTHPATVNGLTLERDGDALVLHGTPAHAGTFAFTVSAQDSANHATSFGYTLQVDAEAVTLNVVTPDGETLSPTSLVPAQVGVPYTQTWKARGGNGQYWYTAPAGTANGLTFTASGDTLTLSGTPTNEGSFGYLLTVEDGFGLNSLVQNYVLNVGPASSGLTLVGNGQLNLPNGTKDLPYHQTFAAFGGTGSYQFSFEPVTRIPTGLEWLPAGSNLVLTGTPAETGSFPIAIKVESGGESVTRSFILTIDPPAPLTLTRQLMAPGMQGMGVSQALMSNAQSAVGPSIQWQYVPYQFLASGGSGRGYTYTATGLPPGLTVSATGEIGGTPALVGDFPITVNVTDDAGHSATKTYLFTVTPSPPFSRNPYDAFVGAINPREATRKAYGFDRIILPGGVIGDGRGQTIAVIEYTDQRTIVSSIPGLTLDRPDQVSYADSDLARFSTALGLPQFAPSVGSDAPVLVKLDHLGGTDYPIAGDNGQLFDNGEFAEDIATIHSLAPMANIVIFVAPPNATDDQLAEIYQTAMSFPHNLPHLPAHTRELLKDLPPVSVVSSSVFLRFNEYLGELNQEHMYLPPFPETQPASVVISVGDTGYFPPTITGPQYPGNSANVITAAMTQPSITTAGLLLGELGVSNAGGGPSLYLPQPSWQNGVVDHYSTTTRVAADVGMIGSLNSGMIWLEDGGWGQGNGSSNAAPAWSALMAIINQGRALLGQKPMNGAAEALPRLYGLPASDFNKVSQLDDGTAVPSNYNILAGLGSPKTNSLVPGMLGGHDTIQGVVRNAATGAGLAGWTVFLDANGDGVYQPGQEGGTTTAADGSYSFLVSPGDNYRVRVQTLSGSGLIQTSTNPTPLSFALGADRAVAGIDFSFAPPTPPATPANPQGPFLEQILVDRRRRPKGSVAKLTLLFAGAVSIQPGAFRVTTVRPPNRRQPIRVRVRFVDGRTEVTLRFLNPDLSEGFLPPGLYKLRIRADKVRDVLGQPLERNLAVTF